MVAMAKPDFVGKRSLSLPISRAPGAASSSGCCPKTPPSSPTKGAQIVAEAAPPKGAAALGQVTSSYLSPTLRRSFALALIADGRDRLGETSVRDDDGGGEAGQARRADLLRQGGRAALSSDAMLAAERRAILSGRALARQRPRRGDRRAVRRALDPARRTGGQPRRSAPPSARRRRSSRCARRAKARAPRCGSGRTNGC